MTGETRQGGRWHRQTCGFLEMPVYVRPGRIVALGSTDDRPDYPYAEGVPFRVCGLADGAVGEPVSGAYKKNAAGKLDAVTVRFGGKQKEPAGN